MIDIEELEFLKGVTSLSLEVSDKIEELIYRAEIEQRSANRHVVTQVMPDYSLAEAYEYAERLKEYAKIVEPDWKQEGYGVTLYKYAENRVKKEISMRKSKAM